MQSVRITQTMVVLVGLTLLGCRGAGPEQERSDDEHGGVQSPPAAQVAEARAMADSLLSELSGRLMKELAGAGPASALEVCSEVAQQLTDARSTPSRSIRRVSRRPRNPLDAPDAYESPLLEEMARLTEAGERPAERIAVRQEQGREVLRVVRPIHIAAPCLACHGPRDSIDADVRALLDERYPEDRAVGYAVGDLRGAVSVRIALDGQAL